VIDDPHGYAHVIDGVDGPGLVGAVERLVGLPSLGGTDAELDIQDVVARDWAGLDLDVTTWEIDVAALAAQPDFPGMEVARSSARGVIARIPGTGEGPTLLLLGHTDVVPPGDLGAWSSDPFRPEIRGDRLIGRGACDMKAGTASITYAARALLASGTRLQGDVILAAVSGEEDGGLGTYALLHQGITADACVIPEPTSLDLVPANGGALTFRLRIHGRATHASRRTEGVSAVDKLLPVLEELKRLEARRNESVDPLMQRWPIAYPLSIGTVHCGDWASTVPDLLVAEGRLGVALGETPAQARADLEAALAHLCDQDPWFAEHPVEVEWWGGQFASGRTDPDHPVVRDLGDVAAGILGTRPDLYAAPYGSDLRLLVGAGIPTVHFGPGESAAAHAPGEWVDLRETMACAQILAAYAMRFCGTTI
jgi:acetylornithine deacetylase